MEKVVRRADWQPLVRTTNRFLFRVRFRHADQLAAIGASAAPQLAWRSATRTWFPWSGSPFFLWLRTAVEILAAQADFAILWLDPQDFYFHFFTDLDDFFAA